MITYFDKKHLDLVKKALETIHQNTVLCTWKTPIKFEIVEWGKLSNGENEIGVKSVPEMAERIHDYEIHDVLIAYIHGYMQGSGVNPSH